MARTVAGAALTQQHRLAQLALRAQALRPLLQLWGTVDPTGLAATIGPFASAAALLVRAGNQQSAALASRYFTAFRQAEDVSGLATIFTPEALGLDLVEGLLRGAGLSGIISGRQRGFSPQAAARNGFTRVAGTASELVLDGGRQVVIEATASDRASTGKWQRVAAGSACAFCAMLASRGPAFSARSAKFEAHAGCSCSAEPVFEGSKLPATSQQFRDEWEQAQREIDVSGTSNDALNAFRRLREDRPTDGRRTADEPAPSDA